MWYLRRIDVCPEVAQPHILLTPGNRTLGRLGADVIVDGKSISRKHGTLSCQNIAPDAAPSLRPHLSFKGALRTFRFTEFH
jgi:hypothetical protein